MSRTFWAIVLAPFIAVVVFLTYDHMTDPQKQDSVQGLLGGLVGISSDAPSAAYEPELPDEQKLARMRNGVYTPEIVVFATTGYENEVINSRFLDPGALGLEYLTYLIEGSVQDPSKVDFCLRVLPKVKESYRLLDAAFGTELSAAQQVMLDRIKVAYGKAQKFKNDPACQPPASDPAQQVST